MEEKKINTNNNVLGNKNLVSLEEEEVAALLRKQNLEYTNNISKEVHPRNTIYTKYIKRLLDIMISLPIVIVLAPLNLIFAIGTFFDVGRPVLYKQTRVGRDGKTFMLVKFRNMNNKTDADGRLLPPSQRVTEFGHIMRKFSLDELLNFWSVLKGDMSLIGPRPAPVFIYERMSERHKQRCAVCPGLECPRILTVEGEDICKYQITYENDIWYVEHICFSLDVKLCFMLVKMVFSFRQRTQQAKGQGVSYFVGYDENGFAISLIKYRERQSRKKDLVLEEGYNEASCVSHRSRNNGFNDNRIKVTGDK